MVDNSLRGLIIAAPSSGSGKTTLTLALHRHFRNQGMKVAPVKTGPDYIDPAFHSTASGRPCYSMDSWAMRAETLRSVAECALLGTPEQDGADWILAEGVMGLFDGGPGGAGSTASLAKLTGWPVVLVVDVMGMSASAAALVHGFATFHRDVRVSGVIFNRVGSPRHARLLEEACEGLNIPILGHVSRKEDVALPERHLGLVQAAEHPEIEAFLDRAADQISREVDCDALARLAQDGQLANPAPVTQEQPFLLPALGQRIAIARDVAYAFAYPAVLESWKAQGCELSFFSPLKDEAPAGNSDGIYLPGGYPELYAGKLASSSLFMEGLRQAAGRGANIYGECGGYMTLGKRLIDKHGQAHAMAGLLPVKTSFAVRKRALGYRQVECLADSVLGSAGSSYRAHEFHYSTVVGDEFDERTRPLFSVQDAAGTDLGQVGCQSGTVMGSYIHLLDRFVG
ncbi:cobyrinate a,c-diamide synthase [Kiloniella sp. b19]|uniref:cobyrinate a,c-diamide synthase n=1 Tax=Kiloniella sp. GXU_MW_B19 TaxID=3141326 RepID=UPI0031E335D5